MLDQLTANTKTLAISVGTAIVVGLVVYILAASDAGALRGRIAELTAELDGIKATQASTDQRLADGDAQSKASALRLDELAGRLEAIEKTLAPPAPAAAAQPEAQPAAPAPVPEAQAKPAQ